MPCPFTTAYIQISYNDSDEQVENFRKAREDTPTPQVLLRRAAWGLNAAYVILHDVLREEMYPSGFPKEFEEVCPYLAAVQEECAIRRLLAEMKNRRRYNSTLAMKIARYCKAEAVIPHIKDMVAALRTKDWISCGVCFGWVARAAALPKDQRVEIARKLLEIRAP